jgi:2-dehydro-3-deoxyphosphogluconate aldolase/(4S)-4-hydroxy-2-oxoglutarate aldolase
VNIDHVMRIAPVIPVLTIDDRLDAAALAETLVAAGLPVIEVTLRTPEALNAIRAMAEVEGAIVGAGTVLDPDQLAEAIDAGAKFIVSPGLTDRLARAVIDSGTAYLPGIATAGDIMRGLDLGLTDFKFFPAEAAGGLAALNALAAGTLLSHRRDSCRHRRQLAGASLGAVRRWELAGSVGRNRPCRDRHPRPRRGPAQVSGFPRVSLRKKKATTTLIAVKITGYQRPA